MRVRERTTLLPFKCKLFRRPYNWRNEGYTSITDTIKVSSTLHDPDGSGQSIASADLFRTSYDNQALRNFEEVNLLKMIDNFYLTKSVAKTAYFEILKHENVKLLISSCHSRKAANAIVCDPSDSTFSNSNLALARLSMAVSSESHYGDLSS